MQILARVWNYNGARGDVDRDDDDGDEDDDESSKIRAVVVMDPLPKFSFQIPSEGEVSLFHESPITILIVRGETV
jgi:hypothetical protein